MQQSISDEEFELLIEESLARAGKKNPHVGHRKSAWCLSGELEHGLYQLRRVTEARGYSEVCWTTKVPSKVWVSEVQGLSCPA